MVIMVNVSLNGREENTWEKGITGSTVVVMSLHPLIMSVTVVVI